MNMIRRCVLIIAGLAISPLLFALAPHPTVMTVKYRNQFRPVIRVIGTDPVVLIDGKEHRVVARPVYLAARAVDFAPQSVRIVSASMGGVGIINIPAESDEIVFSPSQNPMFGTNYFEAVLQAPETLKGGFIAVTLISGEVFNRDAEITSPTVMVHELPELTAGTPVRVKFSDRLSRHRPNQKLFIQIFDSQGRELRSNGLDLAWKYYSLVERTKLKHAIEMYREQFRGADHAAMPLVVIKPMLPVGYSPWGKTIKATMDVTAKGEVSTVTLEPGGDEITRQALHNALDGWLFLPKLKAGRPVPTKVEVPLSL